MALNTAAADALANTITNNLASSLGLTPTQKTQTLANVKIWTEAFYTALKTDIVITILSGTIVTVGSATTQTGPAAPIPLSPA